MEETLFKSIYGEEIYATGSPVTIILDVPWHDVKAEQRLLLGKILLAVKLSPESVRIIHQPSLDLSALQERPRRLLAFIAPPKGISTYEIIQTGASSVVFSDPLATLQSDEAAKRRLWGTLKTFFSS